MASTKYCPDCHNVFDSRGLAGHLRAIHGYDWPEATRLAQEAHEGEPSLEPEEWASKVLQVRDDIAALQELHAERPDIPQLPAAIERLQERLKDLLSRPLAGQAAQSA